VEISRKLPWKNCKVPFPTCFAGSKDLNSKDLSKNTVLELNCVKASPFFPLHFQGKAGGETLQYTEECSSCSSVSFKKKKYENMERK